MTVVNSREFVTNQKNILIWLSMSKFLSKEVKICLALPVTTTKKIMN